MKMLFPKIFTLVAFLSLGISVFGQSNPCAQEWVQKQLMLQNPDYEAEVQHYINEVLPNLEQVAIDRAVVTIPVVVHVVHTGQSVGNGANLSQDRIQSQIDILNEDYRRNNDDAGDTPAEYQSIAADTEIQFCLAMFDPDGGVTNGITRHVYSNVPDINYIENTIKPETTWDSNKYLNIWTIDMPSSSVLGYSYLPTVTIVGTHKDGVVIDYPKFGYVDAGNRGRTSVHEVGHYLGLQHVWGENDSDGDPIGCGSDDGISDTPNCSGPHYGCPNFGLSSCGTVDMIMNFMEYVNDECMNLFTNGQKTAMQATLNGIRSELSGNTAAACGEVENSCQDLNLSDLTMGFESSEAQNGWEVENANNDTRTWLLLQSSTDDWGPNNGEGLAVYLWNIDGTTSADDYLFTPCFEVEENHSYKLSFSFACASDNNGTYTEKFEVGFSDLQSSSDFNVVDNDWVFDNVNNPYPGYINQELTFHADADGLTSIGFHVFSDPDKYALQIDDIKIEDLGDNTPVTEINDLSLFELNPNPSTGLNRLSLAFEATKEDVDIRIFNVLGQQIESIKLKDVRFREVNIDLTNHKGGIYFVVLETDNKLKTKKLILER